MLVLFDCKAEEVRPQRLRKLQKDEHICHGCDLAGQVCLLKLALGSVSALLDLLYLQCYVTSEFHYNGSTDAILDHKFVLIALNSFGLLFALVKSSLNDL